MCACVSNVNNAVNGRKQGNTFLYDYNNMLLSLLYLNIFAYVLCEQVASIMRKIAFLSKYGFLQLAPLLILVGDLRRIPATKLLTVHSKTTNTFGIN